ncbi:MAG: hypothetical protein COA78_07845 [Blastopirellula sp.]|nr:MAG: hypothetical protein COA78_07845 [Blastopirellula sp.]
MLPVKLIKQLNHQDIPKTDDSILIQSLNQEPKPVDWRDLHHQVFSPQSESGWTGKRFDSEFLMKDWWNPETMWFSIDATTNQISGSITLELSSKNPELGIVHWLMVAPNFRRQGIALALLAKLEEYAIDHGATELQAETLSSWEDAMAFYLRQGFTKPVTRKK